VGARSGGVGARTADGDVRERAGDSAGGGDESGPLPPAAAVGGGLTRFALPLSGGGGGGGAAGSGAAPETFGPVVSDASDRTEVVVAVASGLEVVAAD
jgi:hypothetical protein